MLLLNILLVFHIIVCILLIGVVLMQQSEGGALGMGGGPSGFMTARGAGNFLTKMTWGLFAAFLLLSVGLSIGFGHQRAEQNSLGKGLTRDIVAPATAPAAPAGQAPIQLQPAPAASDLGLPLNTPGATPAPAAPAEPATKQ